ncbi:MAG TPA: alginate lyase family protein, partial [Candidatus Sulfotelmatobacter sp.]|nr:alginate lyase family protein [Candidatus Sulfotelmatobacter sp.]
LVLALGVAQAAIAAAPTAPGPRLSDEQFFALLDLARPDLAEVRAAVAKADWAGARHALAEHMRSRPMPRWDLDPRAVGRDRQHREPEADKALGHRLSSLGIEWQFGEQIDWAFNPTTEPGSKWPRNHEWTWQLSRHSAWLALGRAFYATGDEKYAREFVAELKSWVQACPVPMEKPANVPFSRWRTIEAGIRAGTVWPQIFPRFLAAQAFDDEALVLMLKSFADHGQYLMKFHTQGNWLTMEANGLYHVGALFPEFKEAQSWRAAAAERLDRELDVQVYPDGAQIELAPGYHGVTIHNFLGLVKLIPQTGFELPRDYLPKMEKMFDYLLYSMQPDRRTAPLNDSGAGNVLSYLEEGAKYFPQRSDFRWAVTEGKEGKTPGHTSHEFPYAGQFILRSGWDREALWLCMDGGPFGFGHQHEDKLSVILTAYGQPLLVEGGVYTYDASDWRRYVLSSRAHNLVLVDGMEQNRRHEPRESYVVKQPLPHVWESSPVFDHVAARYDEGWGPKASRVLRQTRHVFFLKPDLFVIADELE